MKKAFITACRLIFVLNAALIRRRHPAMAGETLIHTLQRSPQPTGGLITDAGRHIDAIDN
jgi:hypothetical protein